MAYTKVFTNPHPNGWDNPSERPPITADVLQAHTDAIQAIDNYLAAGGGAGGGGGGSYVLPVATKTILGGVKVDGDTIAVTSDGTISVTAKAGAIKNTSDLTNDGSGSGSYFVEASELAQVAFAGNWSALEGKPTIPTKTSQLTNDSNFLTSIPKASITTLGGVKVDGETVTINTDGTISIVESSIGVSRLADLQDVGVSSIVEGDVLTYNEELGFWTNQAIDLGAGSRELTLAEYDALTAEEKNNDTTYFITDAENVDLGSVGTAGTLKPWLYNSDEEVVIGVYDGKPLYRKTLVFENHSLVDGDNYIELDIDIDKIVNTKAFNTNSNHTYYQPMNQYVWNLSGSSMYYFIYPEEKHIYIRTDGAWPSPNIYFTLEYTKTIDAEGSGVNLMPYSFVQNCGGCNYSTEEQIIGRWIDGKPLYQKTVHHLNTQSSFSDYVTIGEITSIDKPIKLEFVVKRRTGENIIYMTGNGSTIPESNLNYGVRARILAKNLQYKIDTYGTEISDMWFTIQYTKTTD